MRYMPKNTRVTYLVRPSKILIICHTPILLLMENRNGRNEICRGGWSAWLRPFNFHIQCDLHREGIKHEMVCILLIVIAFDGMLMNTEESGLPVPQ